MQAVNVCVPGRFDYYDSYGLIACRLVRHLSRLGAHVNGFGLAGEQFETTPPDVAKLLSRPIVPSLGAILLGYPVGGTEHEPTGYDRHANPLIHCGPQVALTMFESSKIPPGWAERLNRCAAVITPSTFCRDVFRDAGVTVPIHVVPLGVSEVYRPAERPAGRPFTFLAFLDRGARKGGLVAQQAFLRAFGDDMGYRLILKSRNPRQAISFTNPNIVTIQRDMSEAELYALYLECDVLVSASTGEGFGLIPREFSSSGGIALATDWSGTADEIDLWGVSLGYTLTRAHWSSHKRFSKLDLGQWAEVDVDALAASLRRVADNRDWYAARARRNAPKVAALYDWDAFAGRVLEIWRQAVGDYSHTAIAA